MRGNLDAFKVVTRHINDLLISVATAPDGHPSGLWLWEAVNEPRLLYLCRSA